MSEPKICPFRPIGVLVDGEDGENIPGVLHQSAAYYGNPKKEEPRTILGIACCEDKCALWDEEERRCSLLVLAEAQRRAYLFGPLK